MTLSDIANIIEIIGVLTIVGGLLFGLVQLKQSRMQRSDLAIFECARSFEDEQFTEAYRLISVLPKGMTQEQMNQHGAEVEAASIRVGMKFETVGLLVYRGIIPIEMVEDLVGGAAIAIWKTLGDWVVETRVERGHPSFMEWYQWLVERLIDRGKEQSQPAYLSYADWSPPR